VLDFSEKKKRNQKLPHGKERGDAVFDPTEGFSSPTLKGRPVPFGKQKKENGEKCASMGSREGIIFYRKRAIVERPEAIKGGGGCFWRRGLLLIRGSVGGPPEKRATLEKFTIEGEEGGGFSGTEEKKSICSKTLVSQGKKKNQEVGE